MQTPGGTTEESPQVSVTDQRRRGHTIASKMTEERGAFVSLSLCNLLVCVFFCVGVPCSGTSLSASDLGSEDISVQRRHFVWSLLLQHTA